MTGAASVRPGDPAASSAAPTAEADQREARTSAAHSLGHQEAFSARREAHVHELVAGNRRHGLRDPSNLT